MLLVEILPWVAVIAFLGAALIVLFNPLSSKRYNWVFSATLALAFFLWSLASVLIEGPVGFWPEHTRNMWGNQIWFDLLLAIGVAWTVILPRARSVNMSSSAWLLLILATGSIGVLAMFARLLYLEENIDS